MRSLPTLLLILSFPAGIVGYAMGASVLSALPLPEGAQGFVVLFGPLFIAGLVMLPFVIPFFDRKAKQDLADHAARTESVTNGTGDSPSEGRAVGPRRPPRRCTTTASFEAAPWPSGSRRMVLKLQVDDSIRLAAADFDRLSAAFFAELGRSFL